MKARVRPRASVALLSLWLAGCTPSATIHSPIYPPNLPAAAARPASSTSTSRVASPAATLPAVRVSADAAPEPSPVDLWDELRRSFVMDDCDADNPQAVAHWAHLFTENPGRFEANLQRALPSLRYIQQIAKQRGIPGEFVLLPWVESHYLPIFGRRDRPVGMWQIMPGTAKSMGLQVDHRYDARLDTAATTEAILDLIAQYYQQYHDWRLTDYAFNSGTGTISRLLDRYGHPAERPAVPSLPVRRNTREHLIKLMAIACVIRAPDTFGIKLPVLAASERLEPVVISKAMPVAEAAAKAGLPQETLTQLNSAFLDGTIDPRHSETLLLPRANVQRWYQTTPSDQTGTAPLLTASQDDSAPTPPKTRSKAKLARGPYRRYTVAHGDTLSSIAQHHHLTRQQLSRWNHLRAQRLHPGQVLRLEPAED